MRLEEMAATSVAALEADRIGRLKPPDCLAQVYFRRFQDLMIMVRHFSVKLILNDGHSYHVDSSGNLRSV